jgi:hypothetical protein
MFFRELIVVWQNQIEKTQPLSFSTSPSSAAPSRRCEHHSRRGDWCLSSCPPNPRPPKAIVDGMRRHLARNPRHFDRVLKLIQRATRQGQRDRRQPEGYTGRFKAALGSRWAWRVSGRTRLGHLYSIAPTVRIYLPSKQ